MTATTPWKGDVYEIHYTVDGVDSILRFRRGELSRGEPVEFTNLQPDLQDKLYKKLKESLEEDERSNQNEHNK